MRNTSLISDTFIEMLQSLVRRIMFVINLVILICVFKHAAGFSPTECENIGDVNSSLELAEDLIQKARKKLPSDLKTSLPKDCEDLLNDAEKKSGVYLVWPINRIISGSISVYCDMDTDGGGWTVIQRRGNFGREKDFFNQNWQVYKEGFGSLEEDFWLGNDYIYALSNQKLYSVRLDLGDSGGNKRYAVYDTFWIEEENSNYTLHIQKYKGDAGDSFSYHNGSKFSTKDRDNDETSTTQCAEVFKGGWWFNGCFRSNLNGEYIPGNLEKLGQGLQWNAWKFSRESLATSEIKIRRKPSWVK